MSIWFKKVKEEYGWMGNMAPYPIKFDGKVWLTSEALFQGMRYDVVGIKEIIRSEKSPMGAKMKAKKFKDQMVVVPMSAEDVENMRKCVRMKFDQHPELKKELMKTKGVFIYEDIGNRNGERHKFWGAKKISENEGDGQNMMGKILMELRDEYLME
ncbi:MAG: NADAR family protein [Bacteroidetes bacterium]|nr:NADAR family protein [Bacteroidota bacterium]MBM3423958.1 NADAR family protein [Bacteroidota bacterium]